MTVSIRGSPATPPIRIYLQNIIIYSIGMFVRKILQGESDFIQKSGEEAQPPAKGLDESGGIGIERYIPGEKLGKYRESNQAAVCHRSLLVEGAGFSVVAHYPLRPPLLQRRSNLLAFHAPRILSACVR